ncbi:uncharacterized protein at1g04910 [Phtheirospermum japonicum]|uniref:O-fucosyltransferase family protein n=1 Tax=Phtheirospermum japonicum TaxID=374723 RepID=A0A830B6X5_9LAMI|nr:uncharacterized protein at1g04910 [Phtheirospermum japonicum]
MVSYNGGLNQMRAAICDMVAIARCLNVMLIVPELYKTSFWNNPSEFQDIFDVDHFITSLRDDVRILKELPPRVKRRVEMGMIFTMPPISWSDITYYHNNILLFNPQIEELGKKIVKILRQKGPFIVLHLRYEMDMLAFSGCTQGCNTQLDYIFFISNLIIQFMYIIYPAILRGLYPLVCSVHIDTNID